MVTKFLLPLSLLLYASFSFAITPEELRMLVGEATAQQRLKAQRIRGGDVTSLLPELKNDRDSQRRKREAGQGSGDQNGSSPSTGSGGDQNGSSPSTRSGGDQNDSSPSTRHGGDQNDSSPSTRRGGSQNDSSPTAANGAPVSNKYSSRVGGSKPSSGSSTTTQVASDGKRSATETHDADAKVAEPVKVPEYIYNAPHRSSSPDGIVTDAVVYDQLKFGIRIGSWLEGELVNDTSNVAPGFKTFRVTSSFVGRYRMLEAGTELFGSASFNENTQRLEFVLSKGVTPDGVEFDFAGQVFDLTKTSGLAGIIQETMLDDAVDTGVLAGGRSVVGIGSLVTGNPLADAAVAAAGTVVDAGDEAQDAKSREKYIIFTSSQPVQIHVQKSF
jgi:hypothetical protein